MEDGSNREADTTVMAEKTGKFPFTPVGDSLAIPRLLTNLHTYPDTYGVKNPWSSSGSSFARSAMGEQYPGKDRSVIIPPFTPLTVDEKSGTGRLYSASHRMGEAGLWHQVTSQGKDILNSPMMLEVESAGKNTIHLIQKLNSRQKRDSR